MKSGRQSSYQCIPFYSITPTSLIDEMPNKKERRPTTGIQCKKMPLKATYEDKPREVMVHYWDTAGILYHRCITSMHFRRAHLAIVIVNSNEERSLESAKKMIENCRYFALQGYTMPVMLLCNKCKLIL